MKLLSFVIPALVGTTMLTPTRVGAQCPDGSPPPCASARVAVARPAAPPAAAERARRFLILPFRNVTRQAEQDWLVEGSTTMLSDALARWQGITVVPDEKLYPALKRAGVTPGTVAEAALVRRVAEETGGWTAVTGEVLATGGRVRVSARAWDVLTSREIVRAASEIAAGGDVRVAFDSVSLRLLRSVGIDSVTPDLANATTRDLDAYRAYIRGLAHQRRTEIKSALAAYEEAVKRDSAFALAWMRLAEVQSSAEPASIIDPMSKAAQYSQRAVASSAKLPPRQRAIVLAVNAQFRAQFSETRRLLEGVLKEDSTDVEALAMLAGLETFDPILRPVPGGFRPRGTPATAARYAKRVAQLDQSRYAMYGLLAQLYAQAGSPTAATTLGFTQEPSSYSDMMRMLQQREIVRIYNPVLLGDTLGLVPAESLSVIPKDSLAANRKAARAIARQWAERWQAVATSEAAPYQLLSLLYALDKEYAAAVRALDAADSIGVQTPAWFPAARRLVLLGKSGDFAAAARIADSLTTTGFFTNPNASITAADAAMWAFALHVGRGRASQAATLLAQTAATRRMLNRDPNVPLAEQIALVVLMGNQRLEDEPNIPRRLRRQQLDTVTAHIAEFAAVEPLGIWLPTLLPMIAEAEDSTKRSLRDVLPAADVLAKAGKTRLAFEIASNLVSSDSTLEAVAITYPWYRGPADTLSAFRLATQSRFKAGTATVSAQQAVFEWRVDDATPFVKNRAEVPPGRAEYRWEVIVEGTTRYYRLGAGGSARLAGAPQTNATLAELLPAFAPRSVVGGNLRAGVQTDTTTLRNVVLRTEVAPGALRMTITDPAVLDILRRERPATARFRFYPCYAITGNVTGRLRCVDERIPITYAP